MTEESIFVAVWYARDHGMALLIPDILNRSGLGHGQSVRI